MRVLLLITTHLSLEHITFLRKCWPPATHKSSLLREADVTVYISGHLTKNATRALAATLDADSRLGLITFDNVAELVLPSASVDKDHVAFRRRNQSRRARLLTANPR